MIKTILVATDGSDSGTRAVQFAAEAAARYGAGLVVLHVLLRDHLDEGLRRFGQAGLHIAFCEAVRSRRRRFRARASASGNPDAGGRQPRGRIPGTALIS